MRLLFYIWIKSSCFYYCCSCDPPVPFCKTPPSNTPRRGVCYLSCDAVYDLELKSFSTLDDEGNNDRLSSTSNPPLRLSGHPSHTTLYAPSTRSTQIYSTERCSGLVNDLIKPPWFTPFLNYLWSRSIWKRPTKFVCSVVLAPSSSPV